MNCAAGVNRMRDKDVEVESLAICPFACVPQDGPSRKQRKRTKQRSGCVSFYCGDCKKYSGDVSCGKCGGDMCGYCCALGNLGDETVLMHPICELETHKCVARVRFSNLLTRVTYTPQDDYVVNTVCSECNEQGECYVCDVCKKPMHRGCMKISIAMTNGAVIHGNCFIWLLTDESE